MKLIKFMNSEGKPFMINPSYIKEVVSFKKTPEGELDENVCTIIMNNDTEFAVSIKFEELENIINEALRQDLYFV